MFKDTFIKLFGFILDKSLSVKLAFKLSYTFKFKFHNES